MIRLAVLGDPVDHSLSPVLHRAAMAHAGLEGSYEARRVDASGMADAARAVRRGDLLGANITMPHKALATKLSDRLGPVASRCRSVNTWVGRGGELVGHSTDGAGVRFAIEHSALPTDGGVFVLGAGGAAAAAIDALRDLDVAVSARRPETARDLVQRLGAEVRIVPWGEHRQGALVINATPVGMAGEPLPPGIVESAGGLLDMVYGATMTPAIAEAQQRRIPFADGLSMLVGQAVEAFRIWTGETVPSQVMFEAVNSSSSSAGRPKKQL